MPKSTIRGIIILLLLLGLCNISTALYPTQWSFTYRADHASCIFGNGNVSIKIINGVGVLSTQIGNITHSPSKGTRISMKIISTISPQTIDSGIKIIIGKDEVFKSTLSSGKYDIHFYLKNTYTKKENFTVLLYNYGGEIKVEIENIQSTSSTNGFGEGLILTGIGISVVFMVLSILATTMYALKHTAKKSVEIEKQKNRKDEDSDEIIAVIAAAISICMNGREFRIISVEPSPWKLQGRLKNMR